MKDVEIVLGREKTQELFFGIYFSSAQINNDIIAIYFWCGIFFFWCAKNVGIFLGGQILKLGFSWV